MGDNYSHLQMYSFSSFVFRLFCLNSKGKLFTSLEFTACMLHKLAHSHTYLFVQLLLSTRSKLLHSVLWRVKGVNKTQPLATVGFSSARKDAREAGRWVRGYCNSWLRENEVWTGSHRDHGNKKINVCDKADYIVRTEWGEERRTHRGLWVFSPGWLGQQRGCEQEKKFMRTPGIRSGKKGWVWFQSW